MVLIAAERELELIYTIAHFGGLAKLSESEALVAIRVLP